LQPLVISEGQPRAIQFYNARPPPLEHFHRATDPHAQFLQAVDILRTPQQLLNPATLAAV
jgi:hypothetical protein